MYHPHLRPLTTPIATLLSASSQAHKYLCSSSHLPLPTPAGLLQMVASRLEAFPTRRSLATNENDGNEGGWLATTLRSSANALQTPPMHVDHVALAACLAIENPVLTSANDSEDGNTVLGVREMRDMIGWSWEEARGTEARAGSY